MIEHRMGSIFDQADLTHIVHQANLYHTFGAGIAHEIARRFPEAEMIDRMTPYGDRAKLGSFSITAFRRVKAPAIINLYSQDGMGSGSTDYTAMASGLCLIRKLLAADDVLGVPHGIGCGLAGGDWARVDAILNDVFARCALRVVVCRLPEVP